MEPTQISEDINSPKKTKKNRRYVLNLTIIFLVAIGFTAFTLFTDDNLNAVLEAFSQANAWVIAGILLMMAAVVLIESTILFILARLYTTRYNLRKGIGNFFIGIFFSHITPSSSGGQFAQAYTFKKQGLDLANAASILVMHFLLYQIAQVFFGVLALVFRFQQFASQIESVVIGDVRIPIVSLSLIGFGINFLIIFGILLLASSKFIHNVLINGIVTLLGKMKIIKNPDTVKANLQLQIENFRIELKRLQANKAVTWVLLIMFFVRMVIANAIPYVSALAFPTINLGNSNLFDGIFMSAYLQVIVAFVPLPGAVGFSEFFFSYLFASLFGGYSQTIAPQLIWRGVTFYLMLILGAITLVVYRFGSKEAFLDAQQKSFVDIQRETIEFRRQTSEFMMNTQEMKTVNFQHRMSKMARDFFGFKRRKVDRHGRELTTKEIERKTKK
jgi:uncharacterized protein (TIRG00374 family)